jgi:hypothetical protein
VARAGGVDPLRSRTRGKLLSETLWAMLVDVWQRDSTDGHRVWRYSGAWAKLGDREPEPFVRWDSPGWGSRDAGRMWLTDAGRQHYVDRWADYAAAYPGVDAPNPAGPAPWREEVVAELTRLADECASLGKSIAAVSPALKDLERHGTPAPAPTLGRVPAAAAEIVARRVAARAAFVRQVEAASEAYRAALMVHEGELAEPYREACTRYVATAAAVLRAVVEGGDPVAALAVDMPPADEWPWLPAAPATGLPEMDERLLRARQKAASKPRRRQRSTPVEVVPAVLDEGARVRTYAAALAELVVDDVLTRLQLRAGGGASPA